MTLRLGALGFLLLSGFIWSAPGGAAEFPGRQKAQQVCAVCHGIDGIGKIPDVPNLAGESPSYIEKQLKAFRGGERKHEQMSIIAKDLKDQEIKDLAKWYASIKVKVEVPN